METGHDMKVPRIIKTIVQAYKKVQNPELLPSAYFVIWDEEDIKVFRRGKSTAVWEFGWGDVEYIAYFDTEPDLWSDDSFLVFKVKGESEPHYLSLDWEGVLELSAHVDDLDERIFSCAANESVIVWPPERAGESILETDAK
jgi:hypothetical protein